MKNEEQISINAEYCSLVRIYDFNPKTIMFESGVKIIKGVPWRIIQDKLPKTNA